MFWPFNVSNCRMKKIFYICTNPIESWDIFTPLTSEDSDQKNVSLLYLYEQNLENSPVSQVWSLNGRTQDTSKENALKNISYQDFLEQIFSHDLSVVI